MKTILVRLSLLIAVLLALPALPIYAAVPTELSISESARIRGNGTLQLWSVANEQVATNNQTFRLRRAELRGNANWRDLSQFTVMIDPAKLIVRQGQATPAFVTVLQDLILSARSSTGLELLVGQMKTPTTAEGLDSTTLLPLPERSLVGRSYGDRRELGVMARFRQPLWNAATMFSTGQTIGTKGHHGLSDWHTRIELTPSTSWSVGTFATLGNFEYSKHGRYGINARLRPGKADLRAEFAHGRSGTQHGQGITTEVGYWITERLEPVARFEAFLPNQKAPHAGKAETLGVNYLLPEYNTKIQLSASALQNMAAENGTPAFRAGALNREVTLALQAAI